MAGATGLQFLPPGHEPPRLPADVYRAAWIGVEWAMEPHDPAELRGLAADLSDRRIRFAYLYVSYLRPDGTFNPTFDHARTLTDTLRALAPDITLLAWIGVPIQGSDPDGFEINRLEDTTIRGSIAKFAAFSVSELGFDGVHLNAELAANGDTALLDTLRGMRESMPDDALLSTTAHALRLTEPVTFIPYPAAAHHWSVDYLRDVAATVDQIALMAYDSGLPFPADYRRWMTYQVVTATEALAGASTDLVVGIPTSEEWTPSHQTQGETLDTALWGLRNGLAQSASPQTLSGIAIYPYWETSADEWVRIIASAEHDP
ncbi:MAG: hypothetical protein BroJett007_00920 [Chloroflexota bacterium]|nr:MAG: hypothetical protein BroJett007_00920 [Chloroflexota bacterium]